VVEKMLFQKGEAVFAFHFADMCPFIETNDPAVLKGYFARFIKLNQVLKVPTDVSPAGKQRRAPG